MSNKKLYVRVLLDASGSMLANKGQTITAYNQYIDSLEGDATVSLDTFTSSNTGDTIINSLHRNVPKEQAKLLRAETYVCKGGTPLYDAIGSAVQSIDSEAGEYDRIVLVIQTDGAENTSREFNRDRIKQLLQDRQDGEGWLVVFLGANLDAYAQADVMGIRRNTSMVYGMQNSGEAMLSAGRSTMSYASAPSRLVGAAAAAFTDEERKRAK